MGDFKEKHGPGAQVAPELAAAIKQKAPDDNLACAVAFDLAAKMSLTPAQVGQAADIMEVRLTKCQLGLFGYSPDKKMVEPAQEVSSGLEKAIKGALADERLACSAAWEIAGNMGLGKMKVSAACEKLGIKIKPCQLGAF